MPLIAWFWFQPFIALAFAIACYTLYQRRHRSAAVVVVLLYLLVTCAAPVMAGSPDTTEGGPSGQRWESYTYTTQEIIMFLVNYCIEVGRIIWQTF